MTRGEGFQAGDVTIAIARVAVAGQDRTPFCVGTNYDCKSPRTKAYEQKSNLK